MKSPIPVILLLLITLLPFLCYAQVTNILLPTPAWKVGDHRKMTTVLSITGSKDGKKVPDQISTSIVELTIIAADKNGYRMQVVMPDPVGSMVGSAFADPELAKKMREYVAKTPPPPTVLALGKDGKIDSVIGIEKYRDFLIGCMNHCFKNDSAYYTLENPPLSNKKMLESLAQPYAPLFELYGRTLSTTAPVVDTLQLGRGQFIIEKWTTKSVGSNLYEVRQDLDMGPKARAANYINYTVYNYNATTHWVTKSKATISTNQPNLTQFNTVELTLE